MIRRRVSLPIAVLAEAYDFSEGSLVAYERSSSIRSTRSSSVSSIS
jgi:hypothetical protein